MRRFLASLFAFTALLVVAGVARAEPRATVTIDAEQDAVYAGLPFILRVSAQGFDETPTPTISEVQISGCRVTPLGVLPQTSTQITSINGRTTRSHQVRFVYQFRVVPEAAGTYRVPVITVSQGAKTARTRAAKVRASDVEASSDMRLAIEVPDRPIWLGESFPIHIDWYLRRQPQDQTFMLPIFESSELSIAPPAGKNGPTLSFFADGQRLELPYEDAAATIAGKKYTRYRFTAVATAHEAGTLSFPPANVVAELQIGSRRGGFGFRVPEVALFRATSDPVELKIRPLPLDGRPPSFANAIGSGYAIEVTAGRTVVAVGEPIALAITIRSDAPMTGLRLPSLTDMGLSPDDFDVIGDSGAGQKTADGLAVTFEVTARLASKSVTAVPPLAFSFFDPASGAYKTVSSEPIALKVAGSAVVGAADVVSAQPGSETSQKNAQNQTLLAGADLALSDPADTFATPLSVKHVWPAIAILYVVPLLVLGFRFWQVKTRDHRGAASEIRALKKQVERAVARCRREPARDVAADLLAALKDLARAAEQPAAVRDVCAAIETAAYAPAAQTDPLPGELCDRASTVARKLASRAPAKRSRAKAAAGLALLAAASASAASARAESTTYQRVTKARQTYKLGLAADDPDLRRADLAQSQATFAALVREHPGHPALLTDWGNAALAASDIGTAALAYRRALAIDPGQGRAGRNLALINAHLGPFAADHPSTGAVGELVFWRDASPAVLHIVAAAAFAIAILLLTPMAASPERRKLLRRLAAIPLIAWLALLSPLAFSGSVDSAAVVVTGGHTLRTADSPGAPAASTRPIPAGAAARITDHRDAWTRIILPTGQEGWLPAHTVQPITAP